MSALKLDQEESLHILHISRVRHGTDPFSCVQMLRQDDSKGKQ